MRKQIYKNTTECVLCWSLLGVGPTDKCGFLEPVKRHWEKTDFLSLPAVVSWKLLPACVPFSLSALSPRLAWTHTDHIRFLQWLSSPSFRRVKWEIWVGETSQEPPFPQASIEQVIIQYLVNTQGFVWQENNLFLHKREAFYFSRYFTRKDVKGQFKGEFLNKTQSWRSGVVVQHLPSMCHALGLGPSFKMKAKAKSSPPPKKNKKTGEKKTEKMNKIKHIHIGSNTYICSHAIICVHTYLGAQECWNGFADRWETIGCQQRGWDSFAFLWTRVSFSTIIIIKLWTISRLKGGGSSKADADTEQEELGEMGQQLRAHTFLSELRSQHPYPVAQNHLDL